MSNSTTRSLLSERRALLGGRLAPYITLVAALLGGVARVGAAQVAADSARRFQFVVSSGALVPTGAQRGAVAAGDMTAAQLSYRVLPQIAVTGALGWTRSHDVVAAGQPTLDVFTYDVGAELRGSEWVPREAWSAAPFVGAGVGGRSYRYRNLGTESTHNLAGYASVGGEVGYARLRLRLEVRDYVSGFKALGGLQASDARNDVALLVGIRITAPRP